MSCNQVNNNNTDPHSLLREIHLFLCDHVSHAKIMERVHTIKEQLKRPLSLLPVDNTPKIAPLCCTVCGNTNEYHTVMDYAQGLQICLGEDGQGCGGVIQENLLKDQGYNGNGFLADHDSVYELFSPQYALSSQWEKGQTQYKRLNMQIERDLVKYNRDDTMTSDQYKDKQREEVYALLDEIVLHTAVSMAIVNEVKVLFHEYRSKMYRVHKIEVALVALFYIVLCPA